VIYAYFVAFFLGENLKWILKNVYCSAPNRPGLSNSEKNVNAAAENDAIVCSFEMT